MDGLRGTLRRFGTSLDAAPSEVAGLLLLLLGGLLVSWLVWSTGGTGQAGTQPVAPPPTLSLASVTVHVAGAVTSPGLVELTSGQRVADAIAAAGGPTLLADLDGLNLAREVEDGERIEVPERGLGGPEATRTSGTGASAVRPDGRVDLNLATAADLEELPGIGPVLAGRIIAWREANGRFREVGQLREVSGIGERTFQSLAELVAV